MSAYLVSKRTIDYLISAGLTICAGDHGSKFRWYHKGTFHELTQENASEVGTMLWRENVKSLAYRYPDDESEVDPRTYEFQAVEVVKPAQTAEAVRCLEYQSCEHPAWNNSQARACCLAFYRALCKYLPGTEDATWGID